MSDTPRTDAVERAHGLAWFGLYDEVGRYLDGMVKFREKAKELERDLAAANAKLAILSLSAQLAEKGAENDRIKLDRDYAARDCAVYKPLPKEVRDGILTLLTK